jgi:hypothetical protein
MNQVFTGLQDAIQSGDVKQEDLIKDAQTLMGSMMGSAGGKKKKGGQDPMMNMMSSMMGNMMGGMMGSSGGANPMAGIFQMMQGMSKK